MEISRCVIPSFRSLYSVRVISGVLYTLVIDIGVPLVSLWVHEHSSGTYYGLACDRFTSLAAHVVFTHRYDSMGRHR